MKIQTSYGEVHVLTNCPLLESTERLEFMTEVHEAFDGSEQRSILRDRPRQILNFSYISMRKELGDMFHMLYANLRKQWGIPLRQIKRSIPDITDDDYIILDAADTIADLRVGFAFIESKEGHQVVEITERGRYIIIQEEIRDPETDEVIHELITEYQDGFRLAKNITATNAVIMPLRICIIDGDASINAGGFWAKQNVAFRVLAEDCPEVLGDVPEQYKSQDIYFNPLLLDGESLDMSLHQHQNIVDSDIGGFQSYTNWKNPRYTKPYRSLLKDQEQLHEYRRFLFRRMGRFNAFWMPLYERHLNLVGNDAIYNSITVDNKYVVEANRKHIAFKVNDQWSAHEITDLIRSGETTLLYFSPNLNIPKSAIQAVCYLGLYRLASDGVEFSFLGNGKSQVTVPIVELEP